MNSLYNYLCLNWFKAIYALLFENRFVNLKKRKVIQRSLFQCKLGHSYESNFLVFGVINSDHLICQITIKCK